eukprot:10084-Heterococcus_DN1.PRE.2
MARNEFELDYDERNPFVIDCAALKPIYKGSPTVKCPYCGSNYTPDMDKASHSTALLCSQTAGDICMRQTVASPARCGQQAVPDMQHIPDRR